MLAVHAFRRLNMVKTTCWSSKRASGWGRKGLGMCHGYWPVWVAQKLMICRGFHTQPTLGFTEKDKLSSEWQLCGRKSFGHVRDQRRMGRLVWVDKKATATQTRNKLRSAELHLWTRPTLEKMGRWAAEDLTRCHSCQLTTEVHADSPKLEDKRLEKCCLVWFDLNHWTSVASTVTRSQSNWSQMGDSHHGRASDKSAPTVWCFVNMVQNHLRRMFPTTSWVYGMNN